MRNLMIRSMIALVLVDLSIQPVLALKIMMPNYTPGARAAIADVVVVGKVTSIESDTVDLEVAPKVKIPHKVAVIKIEQAIQGAKNITHLKVAFPAPQAAPAGDSNKPILRRPVGMQPISLNEKDEGVFFLVPFAPGSNIMKMPAGFTPIPASATNYKDELKNVEAAVKIIGDPIKALKSEKKEEQLEAVFILSQKYRNRMFDAMTEMHEVAISKEETQLIMGILLAAEWKQPMNPAPGFDYQRTPYTLANSFGLFPGANGIPQIKINAGEDYIAKSKVVIEEWYGKNKDTFTIKKYAVKK